MRILVTGAKGQLGIDVLKRLRSMKVDCRGVDAEDFDLTDENAVMQAVCAYHPDAIIHCAAYTAVDRAETEPQVCCQVNGMGTLNLVRAALRVDAKLLYVSTDYVFHGNGSEPFETTDRKQPLNIYGLSKLQGEEAVLSLMTRCFVVRTSWVFGANGGNFVKTMLRLGSEKREVSVVSDQIGSPTYTVDLAKLICDMIRTNRFGVYHATNEGYCSWADFAQEIMLLAGKKCRVKPVTTAAYASPTHRPLNSRLSKSSLDQAGFDRLPDWENALARCIAEMNA